MDRNPSPRAHLAVLADGYLATQLLVVAVDLALADRMADGPRTAADLADEVGADPAALHRVLRGLAAYDVLDELGDGRFALTAAGHLLRDGHPGSFRGPLLARGDLYYAAFGRLRDAVERGGSAFELAFGQPFFAHLKDHPETAATFQLSMTDRSRQEADQVVAAYDFARFRRVVDVGGGQGVLVGAVAGANPAISAVLFDQPGTAPRALPPNCEVVAGDFFTAVPAGDCHLLSRVVHDWDDADAVRILTACRESLAAGGTLLLVEALLPARAADTPAAIRMDIHMLALFGGRERTEAEFADLLATAGFHLDRVIPVDEWLGLHILEATPR